MEYPFPWPLLVTNPRLYPHDKQGQQICSLCCSTRVPKAFCQTLADSFTDICLSISYSPAEFCECIMCPVRLSDWQIVIRFVLMLRSWQTSWLSGSGSQIQTCLQLRQHVSSPHTSTASKSLLWLLAGQTTILPHCTMPCISG